ncbi:hypothetical protein Ssi03_25610 [Sphaerisporangium siamense]|uniref:Uncharacterized protein n=1 Tax=Sphaerisporangium siamense TaxID=795645 RepID=A0A7W7D520_9ACTN|nr:hypothetical protein [Sphaerisporangium siamense]MBB4700114.1 hypothetical protein [Sphaerisporangium siamense]GII84571.1 hypothetical protein Ssi03_25610 [Sphaerisporangium siamense]
MTATATITLQDRIRSAYTVAADYERRVWVGLAEVRMFLQDVPRAEVDEALRLMNRLPEVSLLPESNQKLLTRADREAAVHFGGQDKHLLWIA